MKKVVSVATVFFSLSLSAFAQVPNRSRGQGYFFFAPGVGNIFGPQRANFHIAAGGEGFVYRGLGVGVEIGPVGPWSTSGHGGSPLWSDWVVGLGSANLSYHLLPDTTDGKFEPFVTGGYSVFFRAGISLGNNVGAGVNVWLNKNVAMRFEVRDQVSGRGDTVNFRVGMTFR